MKAILADYGGKPESIQIKKKAEPEDWITVCTRYNDDVSRICDVTDTDDFTALYECFDENNKPIYYLVKEEKKLYRLRRRHFFENIGKSGS